MNKLIELNQLYQQLNTAVLEKNKEAAFILGKTICSILGQMMIETAHMATSIKKE